MRYLTTYKIFEADDYRWWTIENNFGVTSDQIKDIFQDILDISPGLNLNLNVRPKGKKDHLFNEVDYIVVYISSENVFSSLECMPMIKNVDSMLDMYGLEIFYVSPLSDHTIGLNTFIKRKGEYSKVNKKIPDIERKDREVYGDDQHDIYESFVTDEEKAEIISDSLHDIFDDYEITYCDISYESQWVDDDQEMVWSYIHNMFSGDKVGICINFIPSEPLFLEIKSEIEKLVPTIEGRVGQKINRSYSYANCNIIVNLTE